MQWSEVLTSSAVVHGVDEIRFFFVNRGPLYWKSTDRMRVLLELRLRSAEWNNPCQRSSREMININLLFSTSAFGTICGFALFYLYVDKYMNILYTQTKSQVVISKGLFCRFTQLLVTLFLAWLIITFALPRSLLKILLINIPNFCLTLYVY